MPETLDYTNTDLDELFSVSRTTSYRTIDGTHPIRNGYRDSERGHLISVTDAFVTAAGSTFVTATAITGDMMSTTRARSASRRVASTGS